jgi:hypothetical protein
MTLSRFVRNTGVLLVLSSPLLGWLYIEFKMKNMEQGIHDDLARIKQKGKTLADIPRKV